MNQSRQENNGGLIGSEMEAILLKLFIAESIQSCFCWWSFAVRICLVVHMETQSLLGIKKGQRNGQ